MITDDYEEMYRWPDEKQMREVMSMVGKSIQSTLTYDAACVLIDEINARLEFIQSPVRLSRTPLYNVEAK